MDIKNKKLRSVEYYSTSSDSIIGLKLIFIEAFLSLTLEKKLYGGKLSSFKARRCAKTK